MKKTFNAEKSADRIHTNLGKFLKTLPAFLKENCSDLDDLEKDEIMEFNSRAIKEEEIFMLNNPVNYFELYYRDKNYTYDKSQNRKTPEVIDAIKTDDENDVFGNV